MSSSSSSSSPFAENIHVNSSDGDRGGGESTNGRSDNGDNNNHAYDESSSSSSSSSEEPSMIQQMNQNLAEGDDEIIIGTNENSNNNNMMMIRGGSDEDMNHDDRRTSRNTNSNDNEDEDNHDDTGDDFPSSEEQQEHSSTLRNINVHPLARPRDHSYLEGASHPLTTNATGDDTTTISSSPTRKRHLLIHDDNINDDDSASSSPYMDLAILELNGVVLFPGSTIPVKLRDRALIRYIGRQIDLCRNLPHLQQPVRLGILTYEDEYEHDHRIRNSNPSPTSTRSRSDDDEDDEDENENEDDLNNDVTGQERQMIMRRRLFGNTRRWFQQIRRRRRLQRHEPDDNDIHQQPTNQRPFPSSSSSNQHRFLGRIGTIATIQHTHERSTVESESLSSGSIWGRYEQNTELVFTAVGTSRFQVMGCKQQGSDMIDYKVFQVEELIDRPLELPSILKYQRPSFSSPTSSSTTAPSTVASVPSATSSSLSQGTGVERQNQFIWNLSMVTPVPHFVYQQYWPWKIVESLLETLQASDGRSNLPTVELGDDIAKEPTTFSFWMASNLPLSENERLNLLEMHSTYERLKVIENFVKQLIKSNSYICCKHCQVKFTNVTNVFTVGGAEGATSNYGKSHCIFLQHGSIVVSVANANQTDLASHLIYFVVKTRSESKWVYSSNYYLTRCR